jgi:hypothetical protein
MAKKQLFNRQLFNRALKLIAKFAKQAKTNDGRYRCEEVTLCTSYVEPGYDDPASGVIAFGNWNVISRWVPTQRKSETIDEAPKLLGDALGKLGVELEWSDEWAVCSGCQRAVRTKADSYQWQRSYIDDDGEIICKECIDPKDHLANLEGKDNSCDTLEIDPSDHGYTRVDHDFENGLHEGMADDPKNIAKALRSQGIERFLFVLDEASQFFIRFSVWIHDEQFGKFDFEKFEKAKLTCDGPTPVEAMKTALESASVQMNKLPDGQGVKVAECKPDGTAEVRVITPQEFIEGKAFKK